MAAFVVNSTGLGAGDPAEVLRALIDGLLVTVFVCTGLAADFTQISGAGSPMEDFAVSWCPFKNADLVVIKGSSSLPIYP
ncbi:hypothetical protein ACSNOI_13390 [Actinomadura kijaniata]